MPSASYAQPVKGDVAFAVNGNYARLIFKFDGDVETEAVVAGGILIVRFNRPVDVPIEKLSDAAPGYVGLARRDPDGSAIRLALSQKIKVNMMTAGDRVFIDLLPESWAGQLPPLPPEVIRELSERALAAERALRQHKGVEEVKKRPVVRVRVSVQPTFVRLVFEIPDGVGVSSSLNVQKFSLSFTSALTFDLADAKISMPTNIRSIDQQTSGETSTVDITLIGEVDVRSFREEKNYIVDIGFGQGEKSPFSSRSSLPDTIGKPGVTGVSASKVPEAKVPEKVPDLPPPPPSSEQIRREAEQDIKPEAQSASKPDAVPEAAAETTPGMAPVVKPMSSPQAPRSEVQQKMVPEKMDPDEPEPASSLAAAGNNTIVAQAKRTTDELRMTFAFPAPTAGALFWRADTLWLIFDTDTKIDTSTALRESGAIITDISVVPLPQGQALRIRLGRPQLASVSGDDRTWVLSLADQVQLPSYPLTVLRNVTDPARADVSVSLPKPSLLHRLVDPDAGDALVVLTASLPARGFTRRQDFVEFSLLELIHGIVAQPHSDDCNADVSSDKVVFSRPGGLTLSSASNAPRRSWSAARPILDLNIWSENQKVVFSEQHDKLVAVAARATGPQVMPSHINLARFYLARGFYPEAKGTLDLVFSETKQSPDDPAALIIHAMATNLLGRPELALKDLANPVLGKSSDSQLWTAVAYARQEKWAEAREKFKNVEFAIASLPVDLQRIVLLDAFRASLEVKDYSGAATRSNDLDLIGIAPGQRAAVSLLRGRLSEALGRDKDALMEYRDAAASSDRLSSSEANLRSIAMRIRNSEIKEDDALHDLEIQSVVWRGDLTEAKSLQLLAKIYVDRSRYSEALAALRVATKLQASSETSRQVQDDASTLFSQIYLGAKGDDIPPVEALAMFYDYRDLTPIGRRGDELIRRLADRLAAVDLLDQAGELLQYQIDHRLEGAARAHVAARLATVYLMNRKPDRAISALRTTRIADLAGEVRQQRLLLEARAQSDIGRHDLALDIIANVGGREVVRLRSDIYWASRRWRESSEQIEVLYGERWRDFQPLSTFEKSDIIRAAVGYALAEDKIGLARFREKYASRMDSEDDRMAFDIASKPASASSADFAKIAKMAATIDTLEGFLRDMKTRFPDAAAAARAKLMPDIKADTDPTGSLPKIESVN